MKKGWILLLFAFLALNLSAAAVVFTEDFSDDPMSEWVTLGANNGDNWSIFSSNNAGGAVPEARFGYNPVTSGEQELISPDIDTSGYQDLTLSFKHMLDFFSLGNFTIGVKVYGANGSEEVVWSMEPDLDISATTVSVTIDNALVDTDQLQLSFFYTGDSYLIDYWFVDDVVLEADTQILSGIVAENEDVHIICDALVPVGEVWTLNPGVDVIFDGAFDITVDGEIDAAGTDANPVGFGPPLAGPETGHFVFENNNGTHTFEWCEFKGFDLHSNDPVDGAGAVALISQSNGISFSNCLFQYNATWGRGGVFNILQSGVDFNDCIFKSSTGSVFGGAIYANEAIINADGCLFASSFAQAGSVMSLINACTVNLNQCTLTHNSDSAYDADIYASSGSSNHILINITNSIWWDSDDYFILGSDTGTVEVNVDYCDLNDTSGFLGNSVILDIDHTVSADPLWDDDYFPTWTSYPARDDNRSPLIDGGDPTMPDPDNTVADIGYIYYDQGPHVMGEAYGIWSVDESPYIIGGPIEVPDGMVLSIDPGVEIIWDGPWQLTVNGSIQANGTASDRIGFTAAVPDMTTHNIWLNANMPGSSWFTSCDFTGLSCRSDFTNGGVISIYLSDNVSITDCVFTDNYSSACGGSIALTRSSADISYCKFIDTGSLEHGGAIYTFRSDINLDHCLITECTSASGPAIYFNATTNSQINNCTFAWNSTFLSTSDIYMYPLNGYDEYLTITNTVWWGDEEYFIRNSGYGYSELNVSYCDLRILNCFSNIYPTTNNVFSAEPIWDDEFIPTWEFCPQDDGSKSPLIDAGDPYTTDEDGTVVDIGYAYFDQAVPMIAHVHDIPGDQGHQVQVLWKGSSHDSSYDFSSFYSLWRQDNVVRASENAVFDNAAELIAAVHTRSETLYLRYDDSYWAFIASVPATMSEFYIYNAPTLADSSTTGANDATFKVMHHRMEGLWESVSADGHSVDNIAPDQVTLVTIHRGAAIVNLDWSAVTTGSYEGNSYPELNGVWYKVYAGATPDFVCDESSYLLTTQTPSTVVDPGTHQQMFYKIVSSDQP